MLGLTAKDLSVLTGIPRSTIAYYETEVQFPNRERLLKLCKALNLKEEDLKC